jgi:hypothetical protein
MRYGIGRVPANNGMQRTALRAAADAERYAATPGSFTSWL